MQAGSAGLPAEDRPVLPSTQHMQQGEGRGSESGWRAHRVWGEFILTEHLRVDAEKNVCFSLY